MPESSPHALIIEDEMLTGLTMQMALAEVGFQSFAFASTAEQALNRPGSAVQIWSPPTSAFFTATALRPAGSSRATSARCR